MKPVWLLIAVLLWLSAPASAQTAGADAWRTIAGKLDAGAAIEVRLIDGKRFKATFIEAHADRMLVQRKTRIPVSPEEIGYDAIASLSRVDPSSMSGAKIAGIALGSAGAAIGAVFLVLLATID